MGVEMVMDFSKNLHVTYLVVPTYMNNTVQFNHLCNIPSSPWLLTVIDTVRHSPPEAKFSIHRIIIMICDVHTSMILNVQFHCNQCVTYWMWKSGCMNADRFNDSIAA